MTPRRRHILRAVLALGAALLARRRASAGPADNDAAATAEIAALLALVTDRDACRRLGIAYLPQLPIAERCAERLAGPLVAEARAAATMDALRQALGRRIRADFAERRTVTVDGWILAETEARLLGLVAVSDDGTVAS